MALWSRGALTLSVVSGLTVGTIMYVIYLDGNTSKRMKAGPQRDKVAYESRAQQLYSDKMAQYDKTDDA
eukprot:CAMPEP_0119108492 /NCGR_PEP_ID=MMETSP1180-20130426/14698_1 /TAXON_ID=3052 ORGANISM="Chlamydomonas cf sp, Strain CCMP681" /NCGR_SAMPLE_ID=MMETSP1180 /ASSEMBLY_ACC=CAM_ASM_000741 /LENGTH=68 /DNA_ID=CAMNT_0007094111 /DNA_START=82 /DNA_END=288 /DNA_ORIENTATION=+